MLKRRISTPRAATVVVLAAFVAFAATVAPSLAGSFLTNQRAAKVYVSNRKANRLFLKKTTASNLYVARATAPKSPVAGIAAGTAQYGPVSTTTAEYVPTAFTSFATKATSSAAVITFSGNVTCTSEKASSAEACPIEILIDGQKTGKINLAPATLSSETPVPLVQTATLTTVLTKGGHTIAVQYAGAKSVTFTLKSWNLAVETYPEPEETLKIE